MRHFNPRRAPFPFPRRAPSRGFAMAPRNIRKKKPQTSDDEDEEDPRTLQTRIDDARVLIKNRAKAKVRQPWQTNRFHHNLFTFNMQIIRLN